MAGPRIDPDSPQHTNLVRLVQSRRLFAQRELSGRKASWQDSEKLYRTFVDPDEKDAAGKKRNPWAGSIILPLTFALTQTQLAFDLAAFTQRRPMIGLDGVSPDDVHPARVMEQYLHHESTSQRHLVELYGWLLDRRRYGSGFMWNHYTTETGYRTRTVVTTPRSISVFGMTFSLGEARTERLRESYTRFEGNQSWVADPFKLWWDPRVTIGHIQEGEFVGRTIRRAYSYMREQELAKFYQNVDRIPRDPNLRQSVREGDEGGASERDRIMGLTEQFSQQQGDTVDFLDRGYVDLDEMVVRIMPGDYQLPGGEYPQKWWITLANDRTIVRAEPFDPDHQRYPVSVMEASPDPHSRLNPGSVEVIAPLNRMASWLMSSHVENVKRTLNNQFLVNPGVAEMKDLTGPDAGRLIRIRREFYDNPRALQMALKQFPVQDVTRGNMTDVGTMIEMAQRVAAAPENLQGVISEKDRTLGEQQMAMSSATARLRSELQLAWVQGVVEHTHQRIKNIQQYAEEERFLKVTGNWPRVYRQEGYPFLRVGPKDLQGEFTYQVVDGTIRGDASVAKAMSELWKQAVADPTLRQVYDTETWFGEIAMLLGFTNIEDFLRQPGSAPPSFQTQIMGDEQVSREVEKGNLVPGAGPAMGEVSRRRAA